VITHIIDTLPQALVPILIGFGLVLVLVLGSIASALHRDALDMAAGAELRRLTAPLPVLPGRHQLGEACGTPAQQHRWTDDTTSFSVTELWEALRAEPTGVKSR
jgi:hypothetical protein